MTFAKTVSIEMQKIPTWAKNSLLVIGSSLLLGLFSKVVIPLPFSPVPIVTQGTLVLLLSVLLGSKRAPMAVALFLAQGAFGLPVFAGGAAGLSILIGPRAGYLLGYFVASYLTAKIIECSGKKTIFTAFLGMLAGDAAILLCGSAWLSNFVGIEKALLLGFVPFVLGDLVKMALCLRFLQWRRWA